MKPEAFLWPPPPKRWAILATSILSDSVRMLALTWPSAVSDNKIAALAPGMLLIIFTTPLRSVSVALARSISCLVTTEVTRPEEFLWILDKAVPQSLRLETVRLREIFLVMVLSFAP